VHELTHLTGASSVALRASPIDAAERGCALCPSFAQVATPAFSHAFVFPQLLRAATERDSLPPIGAVASANPAPRSRGPPSRS